MLRLASSIHDLALAFLTGGLAGVFLSVNLLFDRAPSREIAGQVGNAIFGRLGPAALTLALVLLGSRLAMGRLGEGDRASLVLAALIVLAVGAAALVLTPRMSAIWTSSPHAPDGSGLADEAKRRFLALHIMSNLAYMAALLSGAALVVVRAISRSGAR